VNIERRIEIFTYLGSFLEQFTLEKSLQNKDLQMINSIFFEDFEKTILRAKVQNAWFTEENIKFALLGIVKMLKKEVLENWILSYPALNKPITSKKIAVIMAGNIPLVGFHDFLSVLISGNILVAKLSSKDQVLLQKITEILFQIEPNFKNYIHLTTGTIKDFDAVIATGSNNSGRYFDYYFGKYPNIIRKNRHSLAVLNGKETDSDLQNLAKDIFMYFGLGCRNVSKIFMPDDFDIQRIFKNITNYNSLIYHHKYANNFDYNRAVYLINNIPFLENRFALFKEDYEYSSPISVIYYERYSDIEKLKKRLMFDADKIQCIVTNENFTGKINFGEAQFPEISDYADGIDTMQFLIDLQ
jgi:hypothetical protein